MSANRRERVRNVWLLLAAWTVPALLSTFETVMFSRRSPTPVEVWRAFASEAPGWYAWAAFTGVIVSLAHRFPLQRPFKWRSLLVHISACLVVASAAAGVWAAVGMWLRPRPTTFVASWTGWFLSGLPFTVLVYAAVVAIAYTVSQRARLREQEHDAALLARQLAEAQLSALRMQLHPHFLFNTLNAIMALVRDNDSQRAVSAVAMLSELLRTTLRLGAVAEVPLSEEVAFIRRYLAIEQLRFEDRLRVTLDLPADLLNLGVPTFVLQPFVENAVRHGILPRSSGGTIGVAARMDGSDLVLTVRDDGIGLDPSSPRATAGLGISNVRTTLAQLYGSRAVLQLTGPTGGGTLVSIRLPAHPLAVSVDAESAVA